MERQAIAEVVVVEGIRDAAAVQQAVKADVLVLHGSYVQGAMVEAMVRAQAVRGVIVFTDPDHAGQCIRNRIAARVDGVKHAYVSRAEARKGKKVGVEYASSAVIQAALAKAQGPPQDSAPVSFVPIEWDFYRGLGFVGRPHHSAWLREQVAAHLRMAYGTGKAFYQQLQLLRVSQEELHAAWERVYQAEARKGEQVAREYASAPGAVIQEVLILQERQQAFLRANAKAPIPWNFYFRLGLVGRSHSVWLREQVAAYLQVRCGNGKAFYDNLCAARISQEELKQARRQVDPR